MSYYPYGYPAPPMPYGYPPSMQQPYYPPPPQQQSTVAAPPPPPPAQTETAQVKTLPPNSHPYKGRGRGRQNNQHGRGRQNNERRHPHHHQQQQQQQQQAQDPMKIRKVVSNTLHEKIFQKCGQNEWYMDEEELHKLSDELKKKTASKETTKEDEPKISEE